MVYMENSGFGDVNNVLYQIFKNIDEERKVLLENKLRAYDEKKFQEYKEFEKMLDNVKPIKLSF